MYTLLNTGMGLRQLAWRGCGFDTFLLKVFQVEVSATGRSLDWRSPTECGVSECDLENSTTRRPWPTSDVELLKKKWQKCITVYIKRVTWIRLDPEEVKIHPRTLHREIDFNFFFFFRCLQADFVNEANTDAFQTLSDSLFMGRLLLRICVIRSACMSLRNFRRTAE
jgi:hypothetical protein